MLEQLPLGDVVPRRRAQFTLRIHDALPWDARVRGERVKRVADETRLPGNTGNARDLPVRGDTTARDPGNDVMDAAMKAGARVTVAGRHVRAAT